MRLIITGILTLIIYILACTYRQEKKVGSSFSDNHYYKLSPVIFRQTGQPDRFSSPVLHIPFLPQQDIQTDLYKRFHLYNSIQSEISM